MDDQQQVAAPPERQVWELMRVSARAPIINKQKIKSISDAIAEAIANSGAIEAHKAIASLSVVSAIIDAVKGDDRVVSAVRDDVSSRGNNGKLSIQDGAITIEHTEVGTKYDYTKDATWVELDKQVKEAEKARKAREELLKSIKPGKMQLDEETGEVVYGAAKTSKSSYKVTIANN